MVDFKELKKDPKYAGMTKKKIKKEIKKVGIITDSKKKQLNVKKAKQNKRSQEKMFIQSLKKNFITDGLFHVDNQNGPSEHQGMDNRDEPHMSRKIDVRKNIVHRIETAPTVIVDLDFPEFQDKNVS